jgi:magnesium chelatase accessory protein
VIQHPAWKRDGGDWPNRAFSRFFRRDGLTWHVQVTPGDAPVLFMVHGTGAATHSWRDLLPLLGQHFTVVAADLPGHGFTDAPPWHRLSLPGMARDLAGLLGLLGIRPALVVGHSAGAAILARMCLDGAIAPAGLVSLNGAFVPLGGAAAPIFAPLARLLVGLPVLPQLFAWRAGDPRVVDKLLASTGSRLDPLGVQLYTRLVRNPNHAAAALRMMANWDLPPLLRDLPKLPAKLLLVSGTNDRAIPPADAVQVQKLVPGAELISMPGLGHLSHEEDPAGTAALILAFARRLGVLAA